MEFKQYLLISNKLITNERENIIVIFFIVLVLFSSDRSITAYLVQI